MTVEKKESPTLAEVIEKQKSDTSWRKEPWVDQGYIYRRNRVKTKNGTYKEFDVKVGKKPIEETKGK